MYRYYITRKTPEGVMEYPTTTAPNVIESYGQNGSQFEGFAERFWGYVEFEQELPGSDLDVYRETNCKNPCLNHPSRCGQVLPTAKTAANKKLPQGKRPNK